MSVCEIRCPAPSASPYPGGDIAIDTHDRAFATLQEASRSVGISVHEIDHALGLKLPVDGGGE